MSPRPRKSGRRGWPENLYTERKRGGIYYVYRHPQTARRHGMGRDLAEAKQAARILNAQLMDQTPVVDRLVASVVGTDAPYGKTVEWFETHLRTRRNKRGQPMANKTLSEYDRMLEFTADRWGRRETKAITRRDVAKLLSGMPDVTANKYRSILAQLFRFAIAEGLRDDNPAEGTLKRTEVVQRQRLTWNGYQTIHHIAPPWFQTAMDLALQTLQRREDLVWMRFDNEREPGWLFVDQQKVEGYGTGHIRIGIGAELRDVIGRCRDDVACPFLIHRKPEKRRRDYMERKAHPFQVAPEMLTRTFKELRDKANVGANLAAAQRPTFHEIRALGGDLYREAGWSEEAIQRLMGHSTPKMTRTYLDRRGAEVRYVDAEAGLAVKSG